MKRLVAISGIAVAMLSVSLFSKAADAAVVFTEGGIASGTEGIVSAFGAVTISFDGGSGPLVADTGSILYTTGTTYGVSAAPFGDQTGYASIGSAPTTSQSATLSLGTGVNYLGFYWGSVDNYNTLTLYSGDTVIGSYNGTDVVNPANGFQGLTGSAFVNFNTFGTDLITKAVFTSTQAAFEIDSITTGVPEPTTWAMMLLGFAGLGFLGYRRSSAGANFRVV